MLGVLLLVIAATPDGGSEPLLRALSFGPPQPDIVSLGASTTYGATSITTVKAIEDFHWAGCGYEMWNHVLLVEGPDAGWGGFLGTSGSSSCPAAEWSSVDEAKLVKGTIRLTSGFEKSATHRAGKGATLNLVPYQNFAVPREIGTIKKLPQKNCLEAVERPGVHFETGSWCSQTKDALTCLALRNRCDFAIDAEGHEFRFDDAEYLVTPGCVIPAKEHALIVSPMETPDALTFWVARCPAIDRRDSR
ncbi:MAG: hypothetical protein QM817_01915 [Archangium sp.]